MSSPRSAEYIKAKIKLIFAIQRDHQMGEISRKVLHLFANADENGEVKILLPTCRALVTVAVSYVHIEYAKRSSKDLIKICADFISRYENHERIICAFRQPQNMRDYVYSRNSKSVMMSANRSTQTCVLKWCRKIKFRKFTFD